MEKSILEYLTEDEKVMLRCILLERSTFYSGKITELNIFKIKSQDFECLSHLDF